MNLSNVSGDTSLKTAYNVHGVLVRRLPPHDKKSRWNYHVGYPGESVMATELVVAHEKAPRARVQVRVHNEADNRL